MSDNPIHLSIIIPVLNEESVLPDLLIRLGSLRAKGAEVLVIDGGSDDRSVEFAEPLADKVLSAPPGRAGQMNLGAARARGRMLVFLHADSNPAPDWCESLHSISALTPDWCESLHSISALTPDWGFFPVRFVRSGFVMSMIAWFMNQRSRLSAICTGDQSLFVRRDLFERIDGFADQPLMEDIDISRRLRLLSRPTMPTAKLSISARRWQRDGVLYTVLLMWRLRLAYYLGAAPIELHRRYYPL